MRMERAAMCCGLRGLRRLIARLGGSAAARIGADNAAVGDHKTRYARPLGKMDLLLRAGKGDESAADLCAGGVAAGVQDAGQRMRAFARAQVLAVQAESVGAGGTVEICAPLDKLGDAQRAFGYERFGGGAVDEAIAGTHGVFEVQGNVFFAFHGDGNAALRVVGIRFAERFLGDDQNFTVLRQLDSGAKAGDACSHD